MAIKKVKTLTYDYIVEKIGVIEELLKPNIVCNILDICVEEPQERTEKIIGLEAKLSLLKNLKMSMESWGEHLEEREVNYD